MLTNVLGFLACGTVIFFAGKRLSYYGDLLAELTGLGKAWIGLILMAAVTSLPELMVGISSSAVVESADFAVGDILGSCAVNLGVLSLMDVFTAKQKPLFSQVSQSHILAAAFGLILITSVGLGLFLQKDIVLTPSIGLTSISFAVIYFLSMRTIYSYQQRNPQPAEAQHVEEGGLTLRTVVLWYALFAVVIIGAALVLPHFAEQIAEETGLGKSFVGTLLLAVSTSLPEIAVSLAAVRMGSVDLAVGNLLGSNIFNVFILFLDDLFYTKGHLLKDAAEINLLSVFFVVMMTAVAIIGFIFPSKEKRIFMGWDALVIFVLYLVNMSLLYVLTK